MQAKALAILIALGIFLTFVAPTVVSRVSATELKVGANAQYHSITEAIKAANIGDTVLVTPGTYVENVIVDKPLTVVATDGAAATIVKSTSSNKDVFSLSGSEILVQGFTITGGNYGVTFAKASNCILTRCVVKDNTYGVYLIGATANLISNNNLNNNGFGMYLDGSSGNKLANNSARYEKGGGGKATLSDGIYLHSSNVNNVTRCDLSNNDNFGASLYNSKNNVFSSNTLSSNKQFGVRLRDGSDNNRFARNTFSANAENGVTIGNSTGNTFYFNDFFREKSHFYSQENNNINSTRELNYMYSGRPLHGFVGNYYSDYAGSDADGNGIGDSSFSRDKSPLIKPAENYRAGWPTPTPKPSVEPSTTATSENVTNDAQANQRAAAFPGFESTYTVLAFLIAAALFAILQKAKTLR